MPRVSSGLRVAAFAVLGLWPLIYMFLLWIPVQFKPVGHALPLWVARWGMPLLLPLGVLVALVCFVADVLTSERVPSAKRTLWAALLIFAYPFAEVVYFWHYVRPSRIPAQGQLS
jgi:hypothetical protein